MWNHDFSLTCLARAYTSWTTTIAIELAMQLGIYSHSYLTGLHELYMQAIAMTTIATAMGSSR